MEDIVIVSAARTPVGSFNGALGTVPAHVLGTAALQAAMERAKVDPGEVDEVILGQVLAAGEGQNPARQAARAAGCRTRRPRSASTRSAAPGCARSRSPPSRSAPARARWWRPAAWRA